MQGVAFSTVPYDFAENEYVVEPQASSPHGGSPANWNRHFGSAVSSQEAARPNLRCTHELALAHCRRVVSPGSWS
ncbi:MAG: hypothetical protein DMG49_26720 [Acidobacteria bacterium]|nr:MAG: hypothetical protein DMG49_26720 [Acidobacteriota bacterium]